MLSSFISLIDEIDMRCQSTMCLQIQQTRKLLWPMTSSTGLPIDNFPIFTSILSRRFSSGSCCVSIFPSNDKNCVGKMKISACSTCRRLHANVPRNGMCRCHSTHSTIQFRRLKWTEKCKEKSRKNHETKRHRPKFTDFFAYRKRTKKAIFSTFCHFG